jgi:hypothetical protein
MAVPEGAKPAAAAAAKEHNERRLRLLESIAKCCKKQGSLHVAAGKHPQAGDRLKATKALLRAGSTDKIILFAGVSRSREIYSLAANYLQQLDWRNDPELTKAIISFCTKAKAFQQLSGFYDACAQFEVDEFKDYGKALTALKEAAKYLAEAEPKPGAGDGEEGAPAGAAGSHDEQLMALQGIMLVERFFIAQRTLRDAMSRTRPSASPPRCSRTPTRPAPSVWETSSGCSLTSTTAAATWTTRSPWSTRCAPGACRRSPTSTPPCSET